MIEKPARPRISAAHTAATIAAEGRTGTKLPELTACHFNLCFFGVMLEGDLGEWVG